MKANSTILLIILCAVIGCSIAYCSINKNIITHPQIPKLVEVKDGNSSYYLKVIQLDSLKYKSTDDDKSKKPSINKTTLVFQQAPVFLVWIMLILIMITIASGAFPFFIWQNFELSNLFGLSWRKLLKSLLLAITIVILMILFLRNIKGLYTPDLMMRDFNILLNNGQVIIQFIIIATFFLLLPALSLMFLVGYATNDLVSETNDIIIIEVETKKINSLSETLLNSLQYLAIIVVLAGLTTNALGSSIKSVIRLDGFDIFPSEISYVYGLFFTLFLSIMYIPLSLLLKHKRKILLQMIANIQNVNAALDENRVTKISDSLNEKYTALDSIKAALTVLAPLITSFLPGQLQLFK